MFSLSSSQRYFLYYGNCDMRKSFDALCGLVTNELHMNPCSGDVYIFINKARNMIKLLHWESGGFVLYYKRLEKGTLEFPKLTDDVQSLKLDYTDLVVLISGVPLKFIQRRERFHS